MNQTIKPVANTNDEILQHIEPDVPVQVYRNLHKNCLSVRQCGRVKCHSSRVILYQVKYMVSQAGRDRVRREKRKNVHAVIQGVVQPGLSLPSQLFNWVWHELYYNPYECEGFTDTESGWVATTSEFCDVEMVNDKPIVFGHYVKYRNPNDA